MLTLYQTTTQQLLQNPSASTALYPLANLTSFLNIARRQIAAQAQCIRVFGTLAVNNPTRSYPFSAISTSGGPAGVGSVMHVRQVSLTVGSGFSLVRARPFEWFQLYMLNQPVPAQGPPMTWAQYSQGVLGSLYIDPIPDTSYSLSLDTVCLPIDLVDDTTAEAIPQIWTDAVPYFAAYMALLSAQRRADAEKMMQLYDLFMTKARESATPDVLRNLYPQQPDITQQNKLGVRPPGRASGGQ